MLEAEAIAEKIRTGLSGAAVEVRDTTGSGDHFEAEVRWSGFAGLSMVKQHQKVYSTVSDWLQTGELHALALKTSVG